MSFKLGEYSYGQIRVVTYEPGDTSVVSTGKFCSFASGIHIYLSANHRHDILSIQNRVTKKIPSIGNDVWIGGNVLILSGASIGDGAVIGANTVVTKDVPPYAIVCGNPGVIKKYRFRHDQIADLLKYPWWNLTKCQIEDHILPIIQDIDAVILKLKNLYS